MFVSHKLSPTKKTFQKPNILRRKPKVPLIRAPCKPDPAPLIVAPLTKHKSPELALKQVEAGVNAQAVQRVTPEPGTHSAAVESAAEALVVKAGAQETLPLDDAEPEHELVDVEAFLTGGRSAPAQYKAQYEVHTKLENNSIQKWHIDFVDAADTIIMEPSCSAAGAEPRAASAPAGGAARGARAYGAELAEFQCSEPSCGKAFATQQKLRRHRAVHNKRRVACAVPVECPARGGVGGGAGGAGGGAGGAGGGEGGAGGGAACARVFAARELLAEHLRADHRPEDAPHRCGECGRRFFWAVGLRAHARAHSARAPLACGWPGCARVFRQPCRLREHARAHTGDRPYRCAHGGCGWAFRTASKLLRHARQHTGERRHRCACGRAFRRREHLRDHQARHERRPAGAEQCGAAPEPTGADAGAPEEGAGGREAGAGKREARAARTHCTWPLAHHAPDTLAEERSCAVRSDLFLAAANGDDSQQLMAVASVAGGAEAGAGAGAASPLGLLDLMQEELLYTDAVDESSFQVLLLSEELG